MSTFDVWSASRSDERAAWVQAWTNWPMREVFAHPTYCELFCQESDIALCATMATDSTTILYPLILRPISVEPWAQDLTNCRDLTSPYGYGGPYWYGEAPSEKTSEEFWAEFKAWVSGSEIITLFARLSLFPEQLLSLSSAPLEVSPNVVRDLEMTPAALWVDYDRKVRKNVRKAESAGLTVEVDQAGAALDEFLEIYYATMDRQGASPQYYFPRSFFERLVAEIPGGTAFFHIRDPEHCRLITTELCLVSPQYIYSFLGGTLAEYFHLRPNDYLKHEISLWGIRENKRAFVLGGGYHPGDGIFRYKATFAPQSVRIFRTLFEVYDDQTYMELQHRRAGWEFATNGVEWRPNHAFQPSYRS